MSANTQTPLRETIARDLTAGLVVFLVALPLCLGIAIASGAPLFSGLVSGIVGGLLVGAISRSSTSVSGPAAGLAAIVATQISTLNSFETFLLAVFIAGLIQIGLSIARAGVIGLFFPTSVIKGLLVAIGILLILKQIPHLLGHDSNPSGEMSFQQFDQKNTFTELISIFGDFHIGAAAIGLFSMILLLLWDRSKLLNKLRIPGPLVVVLLGVFINWLFQTFGDPWRVGPTHLVQVPVTESLAAFARSLQRPDFSQWNNPAVFSAAITLAIVASLETLLNIEAVDKLDVQKRISPPNRELFAQGCGNIVSGLLGGLPITSLIVRSSVNINAGGQTKLSTMVHGLLLAISVMFLPNMLNLIPLSTLAAILMFTGIKLASPKLVKLMWAGGKYQFAPFAITVIAIVFSDLLTGILIGLAVSMGFILYSNVSRPLLRVMEKHLGGDVLRIELANQVSFLNRAVLEKALNDVPKGGHVLIDATNTVYIDPDVLGIIREFRDQTAAAHDVRVSLRGFRDKYQLNDEIQYLDMSTREFQVMLTPDQVIQILKDGNERFRTGRRLFRDFNRQMTATSEGQHPIAVVLSCIDSRSPAEIIFDLGLGDIFSARIAGNVVGPKILGSMEYACAVAGAKLVIVVGHTRCGAVTSAVQLSCSSVPPAEATGCHNIESLIRDIQLSVRPEDIERFPKLTPTEQESLVDDVARRNVGLMVDNISKQSPTLSRLRSEGRIDIVGAVYNLSTGQVEFFD